MIKVNQEQCIGCGLCVSLCPDVFAMNDDYQAEPIADTNHECAKRAAASCPVDAITIS